MTFGVNVVGTKLVIPANSLLNRATTGHFLFTQLLVPALTAGKETSPDHHSRIIWLSSFGSYMSTIRWNTLKDTPQRKKAGAMLMYFQSKLVQFMHLTFHQLRICTHRNKPHRLPSCSLVNTQSASTTRALSLYLSTPVSAIRSANSITIAECKSDSIGNIKTEIFRHLPTMNRALTVSNISRRIHFGPLTTKLVRRWHSGSTLSSTVRSRNSGPAPCPKLWNTMARSASSYTLQLVLARESNLLQYVVPWARIADRARADAYYDEMCAQLWSWLEEEVEGK